MKFILLFIAIALILGTLFIALPIILMLRGGKKKSGDDDGAPTTSSPIHTLWKKVWQEVTLTKLFRCGLAIVGALIAWKLVFAGFPQYKDMLLESFLWKSGLAILAVWTLVQLWRSGDRPLTDWAGKLGGTWLVVKIGLGVAIFVFLLGCLFTFGTIKNSFRLHPQGGAMNTRPPSATTSPAGEELLTITTNEWAMVEGAPSTRTNVVIQDPTAVVWVKKGERGKAVLYAETSTDPSVTTKLSVGDFKKLYFKARDRPTLAKVTRR